MTSNFILRVGDEQFRGGRNVAGVPLEGALMWAQDIQRTPYVNRVRWRKMEDNGRPGEAKSRAVGHGVLMFAAPTSIETDDVAVELRPPNADEKLATWTFPATFVDRLKNPPSFEVTAFDVPDQIERGVKRPISLSVRNTGGRSDTFNAVFGLNQAEHPNGIEFPIPAGEEATWDGFVRYPPAFEQVDEEADRVEYALDIGHARLQRTVEIVD